MLGLGKEPEFRGDWKGAAGDVGDLLGLHRFPLWSFQSSSSFSMERRLLTLDSFSSDSCRTACSVESCLADRKEPEIMFPWEGKACPLRTQTFVQAPWFSLGRTIGKQTDLPD